MAERLPTVFIPHGGGPWPFVQTRFMREDEDRALRGYLTGVGKLARPRALLVVSAHWEEEVPTVMNGPAPGMLYDYYGFPPESYRLNWPAPGDPVLAARVRSLLEGAGFTTGEDVERGYDHGTFIPMMLAFPAAEIPVVQLSLIRGLDPAQHIAMGRALAPLRDEGVLILGSGMSYHDLRGFGDPRSVEVSSVFDAWLKDAAVAAPAARDAMLMEWERAPMARQAHPREEHLIPLMVVAGAAGNDPGRVAFEGTMLGAKLSAFQYG
jgi:aromatic ring-opening dioxygenase catalytic subunit (LigB family)